MSDDQLDKEFKNRIKQVFDNYEDDSGAEGWALLREKFPEKGSDRVVAWLWRYVGVAAVLLAVLGVALWFNQKHTGNKNIVVKNNTNKPVTPVKISPAAGDTSNTNNSKPNIAYQTPAKPANTLHEVVRSPASASSIIKHQAHNSVKQAVPTPATNNIIAEAKPVVSAKPVIGNISENLNNSGTKGAIAVTKPVVKNTPATVMDNGIKNTIAVTPQARNTNNLPFATTDTTKTGKVAVTSNPSPVIKTTSINTPKKPDIQSLFANDNKYSTTQNNNSDVKVKNRKVVFGVYAATYVNYAKGSNNQFNTGAGISSDIRLTENLSLVTGIAIAQNSFSYNDISASSPVMFPAAVTQNFSASSAVALSQVLPPSKNIDASLVGLDVPVDLKYMFSPHTSSAYISAGLSSGAFINETYNYTYSYNVDNNPTNQESQGATTRRTFNDFYFARMLNLSFGVGYPLGKGNQLIIEPFVKYPLTGLGDQHILFGSGGLNLKLNFDAPKKSR